MKIPRKFQLNPSKLLRRVVVTRFGDLVPMRWTGGVYGQASLVKKLDYSINSVRIFLGDAANVF